MELIYIITFVILLDFIIHGSAFNKGMLVVLAVAIFQPYIALGMYVALKIAQYVTRSRGTAAASR
jgi:hypothetical protein